MSPPSIGALRHIRRRSGADQLITAAMDCCGPFASSSMVTTSATRGSERSRCSCRRSRRSSATACRTAAAPGSVLRPVATAPSAASVTRAAMSVAGCAGHGGGGGGTWSGAAAATGISDETQVAVITSSRRAERSGAADSAATTVTAGVDADSVPGRAAERRSGVAQRWCAPRMPAGRASSLVQGEPPPPPVCAMACVGAGTATLASICTLSLDLL